MQIHFLEKVTKQIDAVCAAYVAANGVPVREAAGLTTNCNGRPAAWPSIDDPRCGASMRRVGFESRPSL